MATDRSRFKDWLEGLIVSIGSMGDAHTAVRDVNSAARDYTKATTENAATAQALTVALANVPRKSRLRSISIGVTTNIALNAANYAVINFYKRTSGTSTFLGSWNTAATTQGAMTTNVACSITPAVGLVTNSDGDIAAGSQIQWNIAKTGTGQLVDVGSVFIRSVFIFC